MVIIEIDQEIRSGDQLVGKQKRWIFCGGENFKTEIGVTEVVGGASFLTLTHITSFPLPNPLIHHQNHGVSFPSGSYLFFGICRRLAMFLPITRENGTSMEQRLVKLKASRPEVLRSVDIGPTLVLLHWPLRWTRTSRHEAGILDTCGGGFSLDLHFPRNLNVVKP
jgi:hypothetical protein